MKLLVLLDRSYFTWTIFEETQKLEKKIGNYTRNALERKVMEMRDMIGNVAHDLKTPLTSFMTATEMIQMDMKSCQENLRSLLSEVPDNDLSNNAVGILKTRILTLFEELSSDVVCSISSIKDIQLFMLMMINRSIDFKKASKGIELTPMKEMVNLSEAISMPVQCMINLQNKIKIHVNEIPDSIHGYIKTDKQWLQENLLCVLSNAVKHSTGGTVKLTLSLKGKKSLRNPGTVHREVIARHSIASVNERKVSSMLPLDVNRATPATSRNQSVEFPFQQLSTITSVWVSALKQETRAPSKYWEPIEPTGDKDLYLLFEIEDNGVGLSADELVTFFNPFKQKRLSGGTGLGLYALAKRIEALGGQYGVRVREDGFAGSVVWFTIPYQPDQIQSERDSSDHPSIAAGATVDKKPIHSDLLNDATSRSSIEPSISPPDSQSLKRAVVLIVEDAPAIAKMTCKMLNRLNIDAEIAENGQIALEKIIKSYEKNDGPKTRYDAILMDFQMPVMDGIEATAKIREYEKMHDITESRPIIGISAISDTEVIDQGLKSGMNGFIPKPFSSDDFLNHLKKSTDS